MFARRGSFGKEDFAALAAKKEADQEALELQRAQERLAWSKKFLLPNSKFLEYWLGVIAPIIVYNVFFVPIDVMIMEKEGCDWQCYMEYAFDFLFFIDMIINFRTAYFNDDNELVLDNKKVFNRYYYGMFWPDLLATVPFDLFAGDSAGAVGILRLPRLLRLFRLFKKLDIFPSLRIAKLIFTFFVVAHINACCWWWVGKSFWIFQFDSDGGQNFTTPWMLRMDSYGFQQLYPDQQRAYDFGPLGTNTSSYEVIYLTSLYWSLLMLLKSPHVGPDTLLEKLFCSFIVVLALFVFAKLVAEVTGMFLAFDKSNRAFRDQQGDMARFSASRALPPALKRRLLAFSLADWSVNMNTDPGDIVKSNKLPANLSAEILRSIHGDVLDSPLMRVIARPIVSEVLRYLKVCISLPKEVLIHASDVTNRLYMLKQGSLQAQATEAPPDADGEGKKKKAASKQARASTWKQKMQVKMIEAPGSVICCADPYRSLKPLPFSVSSLSRSLLVYISYGDLLGQIFSICSAEQVKEILKVMAAQHKSIAEALTAKTRGTKAEASDKNLLDASGHGAADAELARRSSSSLEGKGDMKGVGGGVNLSDARMGQLEADVDSQCEQMADVLKMAQLIPRMVKHMAAAKGQPMPHMPPAALAALSNGGTPGSVSKPGTPLIVDGVEVTSMSAPPTPQE